ncbi:MAG: acetylglutamate kinase [Paramuribaculum sp.]|nr:acetylglutamate kinase [Paramuribaculum sp.]
MIRTIKVVKIGGNVVNNHSVLSAFLKDFAAIPGPKILVHGGGREATRLSAALGIETRMIDGRRVTDAETLDVVTMVYAGLVNKRIVAMLQADGCDAIGLAGCDAGIIKARRRPASPVDYGFVGDISLDDVNENEIAGLLSRDLTPVFCAITHDGNGQLLNCNADTIASSVACAAARIMPVELVYCFEKPGVLSDAVDESSVIAEITPASYAAFRNDGVITDGMIPKIDNAFAAIGLGVKSVTIKSSADLLNGSAGTIIRK